jgi:HEAT repeat protein
MKKLIAILVLAALAGGGYLIHTKIRSAGKVADEYRAKDYLPGEIAEALRGDDPAARADAAEQIAKMDPAERETVLLAMTRDERSHVRLLAVSQLARLHGTDPDVVGRLLETARDDLDGDVKQAAFAALGKSGDARALKLAVEVLSDTDAALPVKLEAASMLDLLTGRDTKGDLSDALDEAVDAADDLGMAWDEWLQTHGEKLIWAADQSRFTEKE